jgi:hypothetical protein
VSGRAMQHSFRRGRHRWRVQSDERGCFDEIVVVTGRERRAGLRKSGLMLHAEMMNDRSIFVDVAGVAIWVHTGPDGVARITMSEDRRPGAPRMRDLRDPLLDRPAKRKRRA